MTDETIHYQPDVGQRRRLDESNANRPAVNTSKPVRVSMRIAKTRPAAKTPHYARKIRRRKGIDRRFPIFY